MKQSFQASPILRSPLQSWIIIGNPLLLYLSHVRFVSKSEWLCKYIKLFEWDRLRSKLHLQILLHNKHQSTLHEHTRLQISYVFSPMAKALRKTKNKHCIVFYWKVIKITHLPLKSISDALDTTGNCFIENKQSSLGFRAHTVSLSSPKSWFQCWKCGNDVHTILLQQYPFNLNSEFEKYIRKVKRQRLIKIYSNRQQLHSLDWKSFDLLRKWNALI